MFEDITKLGKQMIGNVLKIGGLFVVIFCIVFIPGPVDDIIAILAYLSMMGFDIFGSKK